MTQYGNTLNIQANGVVVSNNGSFTPVTPVNYGVLITNGSGTPSLLAAGTTGQVLTATTSATPSWESPASSSITITGDSGGGLTGNSFTFTGGTTGLTFAGSGTTETVGGTLVVANGGTGRASQTAYMPIVGGTTTTAAQQSVATGTQGYLLSYNGTSALPTWVNTYPGIKSGSAPAAGYIGEIIEGTAGQATVSLSNNTAKTIASVNLTAGNWLISGMADLNGILTGTRWTVSISATNNALGSRGYAIDTCDTPTMPTSFSDSSLSIPQLSVSLSGSATYYLVGLANFSGGTAGAGGRITATRVG